MRRTPFLLTPRTRASENRKFSAQQESVLPGTVAPAQGNAGNTSGSVGNAENPTTQNGNGAALGNVPSQGGTAAVPGTTPTQSGTAATPGTASSQNGISTAPGTASSQSGTGAIPGTVPSQNNTAATPGTMPSQNSTAATPGTAPTQNNGTPATIAEENRNPTDATGQLRISVLSSINSRPIEGATITISYSGEPDSVVRTLTTDGTGLTPTVSLPTPPLAYSLEPFANQPYSEYTFYIRANGYEPVLINGAELLPDVTAIQNVVLDPAAGNEPNSAEVFVIGPHTLYGEYPPKIIEPEIQPTSETGEIVLSRVVIPEYIVVHDGPPSDSSAPNYYVPYRDYIKNVASSEIYATWPEAAIYANILAIQSFTLNRVYTEFYRNKGYNFTITSSTAYDHKWINERNIYDTISQAVDSIFNNYLSRPNVRQPILTQYCDGKRVTCPNLMSQWGSKSLADSGYTAIQILRYYYGQSIFINTSEEISGIPSSYPGEPLSVGSTGSKVRQLQEQLDAIANVYYPIPNIAADGIFGEKTKAAVMAFQKQFDLPQSGIVDFPTWYKISQIYVAISRIAEYS